MLFVEMLTYLEPELFLLIIFHSGTFVIIKILIVFDRNICVYADYSRRAV
jgi:hypothetical protein